MATEDLRSSSEDLDEFHKDDTLQMEKNIFWNGFVIFTQLYKYMHISLIYIYIDKKLTVILFLVFYGEEKNGMSL